MKGKYKIILISILLITFIPNISIAVTNITNCSSLNIQSETYYLTQDIIDYPAYSGFKCINIGARYVTLDCQGHKIDGNQTQGSYGLWLSSPYLYFNATIQNCILSDWEIPVWVDDAGSNKFLNVTFDCFDRGLLLRHTRYNLFKNITISGVTYSGGALWFYGSSPVSTDNVITDSYFYGNKYGIEFRSYNNIVKNSIFFNNSVASILFYKWQTLQVPRDNTIYNNLFNDTNYVAVTSDATVTNYFNTTKQSGDRIYTGGMLGGNYYTNSTGNGFSDTCVDNNTDGFCDGTYNLSTGNLVAYDYLSLSPNCQPSWILQYNETSCFNSTHLKINETYYNENECGLLHSETIYYTSLEYNLTDQYLVCSDFDGYYHYYVYNDTFSCNESIVNYTYETPNLFNLSQITYSCENLTTNKTTYNYTDFLDCGFWFTNYTLTNCPTSYQCYGNGTCLGCGDTFCSAEINEDYTNCCLDCGCLYGFDCYENKCWGVAGYTLKDIGAGIGSLMLNMAYPLLIFLILLALGTGVGYILSKIGDSIEGKI